MKRKILMTLFVLFLVGCGSYGPLEEEDTYDYITYEDITYEDASYVYRTFEEALVELVTDIVIVQYVGHRPFGESLMEFEFTVSERILGDATERIFVYTQNNINAHVLGHEYEINFLPGELTFISGNDYLLPLRRINSPYSNTYDEVDEFVFVYNIMIDLEDPSNSVMYSEALDYHSIGMSFDEETPTREIISFVEELADQIEDKGRWKPVFIRSEIMEDIIKGSPYIWVVEINDPLSLNSEVPPSDWMSIDIYYVRVVQSLKGDTAVGEEMVVIFFADTVLPGEQHIVAVTPINKGDTWHDFTSRNSLFRTDQLEEIMQILDGGH